MTSQAGPFGTVSALGSEELTGVTSPASPTAHNVDPMKVIVDPPITARLLQEKESTGSRAAEADATITNPLSAVMTQDTSPTKVHWEK